MFYSEQVFLVAHFFFCINDVQEVRFFKPHVQKYKKTALRIRICIAFGLLDPDPGGQKLST
jgi:hypothetical protein